MAEARGGAGGGGHGLVRAKRWGARGVDVWGRPLGTEPRHILSFRDTPRCCPRPRPDLPHGQAYLRHYDPHPPIHAPCHGQWPLGHAARPGPPVRHQSGLRPRRALGPARGSAARAPSAAHAPGGHPPGRPGCELVRRVGRQAMSLAPSRNRLFSGRFFLILDLLSLSLFLRPPPARPPPRTSRIGWTR